MKSLLLPAALFLSVLLLHPAAAPARAETANLLLNPSFEYETAADFHSCVFWTMNQPGEHGDTYGSARRENWRAHDGYYAMAIRGTWADAGDSGGLWQEVPAVPGTPCRFSARAWADAAWTAQTCEIKIEFWNTDHSRRIARHAFPLDHPGETWQEFSVEATAPEDAAWVRAVIHVSGAGPEGALLVDSLRLHGQPAPDHIQNKSLP